MVDLDELERLHRMARPHKWEPIDRDGYSEEEINNSNFIAAIKNACDDGLLQRLRTAEARIVQMDTVLRSARETILDLKNSRWSEMEGSDDDWVEDIDAVLKLTSQPIAAEASLATLKAENERLRQFQKLMTILYNDISKNEDCDRQAILLFLRTALEANNG